MRPAAQHDLAVRMAELARAVAVPRPTDEVLSDVTAAALELIPGADAAGILLLTRGGGFESLATTSDLPGQLDELQLRFGQGPCVEAALNDVVVRTDDFRAERRWPAYSKAVVKMGVLSGLSLKLYTGEDTAGALNLFGFAPSVWDEDATTTGSVLAAHAAAALLASMRHDQLRSAVASRDGIGQAKGIIMERFDVDEDRAFAMLRQLSQEKNVKLVDIAAQVIATRGAR